MKPVYPKFVRASIACEVFGVTSPTLRRWADAGKIIFIKTPGGQYRYSLDGLDSVPAATAPRRSPKPAAKQVATTAPAPPMAKAARPAQGDLEEAIAAAAKRPPAPAAAPVGAPLQPKQTPEALRRKIEQLASASAP